MIRFKARSGCTHTSTSTSIYIYTSPAAQLPKLQKTFTAKPLSHIMSRRPIVIVKVKLGR